MAEVNPLARPRIRRKNGNGYYEEGDRVLAMDIVGNRTIRKGTVGLIGTHSNGQKYLTIRYGEEPFLEAFICQRSDIVEDLPDDNIEAIEKWLESE